MEASGLMNGLKGESPCAPKICKAGSIRHRREGFSRMRGLLICAFLLPYFAMAAPTLRTKDESVAPPQRAGVSERQVSSVWDAALPDALTLSPVLGRDNTTVLVGTDGTLVCIKISDGKVLWSAPLGGEVSSITPDDAAIYVTARNDAIYAVGEGGGELLWTHWVTHPLVAPAVGAPPLAVSGGEGAKKIFVATNDATMYALDAVSGARLPNTQMKTDTPETTWATAPLVLGDRVYNVDSLGNVYAFAVDGGKQAWKTVGGGQPMPLPLFASRDQSVLYVATRGDGWVRAFSTSAGNLLWRVSLLNLGELPPLELVNSKPAAGAKDTGSLLFLPMENGVVKVVATKTGIISRSIDVGSQLQAPLYLSGLAWDEQHGRGYMLDQNNGMQVLVLDMENGAISQRLTGVAPEAPGMQPVMGTVDPVPMPAMAPPAVASSPASPPTTGMAPPPPYYMAARMVPVPPMPLSVRAFAPVVVSELNKRFLLIGKRLDGDSAGGRTVLSKIALSP